MLIKVLPPALANQIAAGEVVERPASVVKELVENALDAGATAVTVEITDGGLSSIRVTDNGSGIQPEDCPTAFLRHATSKISTQEDLAAIGTLGFRGEALASIGAVSLVTMTTRVPGGEWGTRVVFDNGKLVSNEACSCVFGTTIQVDNLFAKVPARLKFMRSPRSEAGYIGDFMARAILGRPDIAFRFLSNGKCVYETYGDGKLKNAVFCVYGAQITDRLLPVLLDNGYVRIEGFVGNQEISRPNRSMETLFVNGRYIRSIGLFSAIQKAYDTRMMVGRYPFALLNITIAKEEVDVNVHPAKTEIRFVDQPRVENAVTAACAQALRQPVIPQVKLPEQPKKPPVVEAMEAEEKKPYSPHTAYEQLTKQEKPAASYVEEYKKQVVVPPRSVLKESTVSYTYNTFPKKESVEPKVSGIEVFAVAGSRKPESTPALRKAEQDALPMDFTVNIIGCAFNTYWIVQHGDDLYLIDQHAAHERRLYEEFSKQEVAAASQELLVPQLLTLQPREFELVEEWQNELEELGYRFERVGSLSLNLIAVPVLNGITFDGESLHQAINAIGEAGKGAKKTLVREKLIYASCKHAVKGGEPLHKEEIVSLLKAYVEQGIPLTCPHGRPVVARLSRRDMERMFKRIV
ncbi:MAG: DNA mismatch repair endonuclease MutL [Clostridia bacterium]|nr:DNA mismatch repair endonuclease MutL [Clostridia bacterium]